MSELSVDLRTAALADTGSAPSPAPAGDRALLVDLLDELFPMCRSITGPGLRASLGVIGRHLPLHHLHVASGTPVFDWEVPPEWRIRSGRLTAPDGSTVVDFATSNLHVVNYSTAVDVELDLDDLQPHLHSLPSLPDAVPYVTSYYRRDWGFCLPHRQREQMSPGRYRAFIDAEHDASGGVDLAECVLPGDSDREILISSYLCHPSLGNNELSGPLALVALYRRLARWPKRRFTYRFVLGPETIGSLCYLHLRSDVLRERVESGLVLTCLGGPEPVLKYKRSRRGDGLIDRTIGHLADRSGRLEVRPFTPTSGSDERQYCSPGFNLPVGNIVRTGYGEYDGYHNSLDTAEFMDVDSVIESVDAIERVLTATELAGEFVNTKPFGEPQLGRYGLYPTQNSPDAAAASSDDVIDGRRQLSLLLEVLSHCDGESPLIDLAERLDMPVGDLAGTVGRLEDAGLLAHGMADPRPC